MFAASKFDFYCLAFVKLLIFNDLNIRIMPAKNKEKYWEKKSEEFHWIIPLN